MVLVVNNVKSHVSLNESSGLVTSIITTSGNEYDGNYLPDLVEADLEKNLKAKFKRRITIYAADRGYDDGNNHTVLTNRKLKDAIKLNNYVPKRKIPIKEAGFSLRREKLIKKA
ncbi:hypothetical protein COX25_05215 [bacterium (Candidatus Howlettbacteria) CG23_combo_of_CG06-09_8_20_14_all_37_9]|nr:MAG: hypothetical protein COX25_05215 [bacterium (Candidatus Howlettbacteria) CG23_combo_of_CG06-09_8_20_14_all_37_9]